MNTSKQKQRSLQEKDAMQPTNRIIPMTPAEEKELVIGYTHCNSPYGGLLIASTTQGICFVGFGEELPLLGELRKRYPRAKLTAGEEPLHRQALALIGTPHKQDRLPLHVKGTPFQLAVWQELIQIPCTETISYGNLAQRIGRPDAARAVGSAVGRNPVACLIPCHRVLHSDSSLGGYHWGSELKVQLLRAEKAPFNQKTIHPTR